jgi:hypothetical protein
MYELEDAVEAAVRAVADNDEITDKRSAYAALYRLQSQFDCSYTQFRVMDLLTAARFMYTAPTDDEDGWVGDGLAKAGVLHFNAGSETWQQRVDAGELTGEDAAPPREVDVLALIQQLTQQDFDLLEMWQPLMLDVRAAVRRR